MSVRIFGVAVLGLLSAGCETQGEIAQPGGRPPVTVQPADGGGVVKRTIEQRSPFGNTTYPANLLADGDFEFTGRTEQMPWLVFPKDSGQGTLNYDTGGHCRSGIRCAVIAPGDTLVGILSSPKTGTMDVSLWIAPVSPTDGGTTSLACNTVLVSMKDFSNSEGGTDIPSETEQPTNGWCHFTGSAPNYATRAPVLWVTLTAEALGTARIDDGVVKPSADGTAGRLPIFRKSSSPEAARVAFIGEYLRAHRRY